MMAVMCLALVGSATATTCDATSITSCVTAAASGLTNCAGYQTYINCYSSCGVNSTYCATGGAVDIWVASVNAAISALGGGCTLTNPCTSSTPTPAVTTTVQSQKIDMTLSGYTGAMKSTYECGYWNTISGKAGASNYCTIAGVGCSVTTNATTVNGTTTPAVTTCTSTTNTYVTGLSSVGSSYSSSRRGAGVTFAGTTLSSLITAAALSTASCFSASDFTTALSNAYAAAGITYTAPTVGTINPATQTASAGTIAPVFGLAAAALFAVINY